MDGAKRMAKRFGALFLPGIIEIVVQCRCAAESAKTNLQRTFMGSAPRLGGAMCRPAYRGILGILRRGRSSLLLADSPAGLSSALSAGVSLRHHEVASACFLNV